MPARTQNANTSAVDMRTRASILAAIAKREGDTDMRKGLFGVHVLEALINSVFENASTRTLFSNEEWKILGRVAHLGIHARVLLAQFFLRHDDVSLPADSDSVAKESESIQPGPKFTTPTDIASWDLGFGQEVLVKATLELTADMDPMLKPPKLAWQTPQPKPQGDAGPRTVLKVTPKTGSGGKAREVSVDGADKTPSRPPRLKEETLLPMAGPSRLTVETATTGSVSRAPLFPENSLNGNIEASGSGLFDVKPDVDMDVTRVSPFADLDLKGKVPDYSCFGIRPPPSSQTLQDALAQVPDDDLKAIVVDKTRKKVINLARRKGVTKTEYREDLIRRILHYVKTTKTLGDNLEDLFKKAITDRMGTALRLNPCLLRLVRRLVIVRYRRTRLPRMGELLLRGCVEELAQESKAGSKDMPPWHTRAQLLAYEQALEIEEFLEHVPLDLDKAALTHFVTGRLIPLWDAVSHPDTVISEQAWLSDGHVFARILDRVLCPPALPSFSSSGSSASQAVVVDSTQSGLDPSSLLPDAVPPSFRITVPPLRLDPIPTEDITVSLCRFADKICMQKRTGAWSTLRGRVLLGRLGGRDAFAAGVSSRKREQEDLSPSQKEEEDVPTMLPTSTQRVESDDTSRAAIDELYCEVSYMGGDPLSTRQFSLMDMPQVGRVLAEMEVALGIHGDSRFEVEYPRKPDGLVRTREVQLPAFGGMETRASKKAKDKGKGKSKAVHDEEVEDEGRWALEVRKSYEADGWVCALGPDIIGRFVRGVFFPTQPLPSLHSSSLDLELDEPSPAQMYCREKVLCEQLLEEGEQGGWGAVTERRVLQRIATRVDNDEEMVAEEAKQWRLLAASVPPWILAVLCRMVLESRYQPNFSGVVWRDNAIHARVVFTPPSLDSMSHCWEYVDALQYAGVDVDIVTLVPPAPTTTTSSKRKRPCTQDSSDADFVDDDEAEVEERPKKKRGRPRKVKE